MERNLDEIDFNSHAHVERDKMAKTNKAEIIISTHTLTWSVTIGFLPEWATVGISTHTLTWSVTFMLFPSMNL